MSSITNIVDIDSELAVQTPQEILKYALENHDNIAISFSGAEDVVLIDVSNLGTTVKDGKNQKTVLSHDEENQIIETFNAKMDAWFEQSTDAIFDTKY